MPDLKAVPAFAVKSLDELFAIAAALETEAIDGYRALAAEMLHQEAPRPAAIFEGLAQERCWRLAEINRRATRMTGVSPDRSTLARAPLTVFDDEEMGHVAPELLDPYRAFSIAVRNAVRLFSFWAYVIALAEDIPTRTQAEQLAREALTYAASLRHDRRRAFHAIRRTNTQSWTFAALELRLAGLLREQAATRRNPMCSSRLETQAAGAMRRAVSFDIAPVPIPLALSVPDPVALRRPRVIAELLLDAYLSVGEHTPTEAMRTRAQAAATELLEVVDHDGGFDK